MMRVIFLDIDGVLNCKAWRLAYFSDAGKPRSEPSIERGMVHLIDPKRVRRLNEIVAGVRDLKVVISSSWRLEYDTGEIDTMLRTNEYVGPELFGATPHLARHERHVEIKRWFSSQSAGDPDEIRFVVLDDDEDAGVGLSAQFVRVTDGLEPQHVEAVRRRLL